MELNEKLQQSRIVDAVIKTQSECANAGFRDFGFESESECVGYVARRGPTPVAAATRPSAP